MEVTWRWEGVETTCRGFAAMSRATRNRINRQIRESARKIEIDAQRRAPKALGAVKESIQVKRMRRYRGRYTGQVVEVGAAHGLFVEFGGWKKHTKKHPPIQALEPYAKHYGIPVGALAAVIGARGTEAQPFLSPAVEAERPGFYGGLVTAVFRDGPREFHRRSLKRR